MYKHICAHFHHALERNTIRLVLHLRIVASTSARGMADSKDGWLWSGSA